MANVIKPEIKRNENMVLLDRQKKIKREWLLLP
jgi:hypothetical protein